MGNLRCEITGDDSNVLRAFKRVQDGVKQTAQIVEQQGQSIENTFNRIKSVASVAFAGFTAKEIVSTLANVRGEFQQLEIAFSTMLGSEQKATDLMKQLTNLAATTPFDMKGVASGAKSLLAYGFSAEEVTDTMRRLGDVCAGLGLNLQDMAWLYGTTRVQGRLFTQDFRQFTGRGIPLAEELAKQFGVTKDKVQDLVTAGKVGFPEVQKAMEAMTNEGGKFGGLMEKQSKSITGQISNIEDTIEMAINDLGTQTEGLMNDSLDVISTLIEHWKGIGEAVLVAAEAIGLYKAMAVGVAAFDTAVTAGGYAAEVAALQSILPLKEQETASDVEEAAAKGRLTAAQAELVASKREEVAAYLEELQAKAIAASTENNDALQQVSSLQETLEQKTKIYDLASDEHTMAEANLNVAEEANKAAKEKVDAAQDYFDIMNELNVDGGYEDEVTAAAKDLNAAKTEQLATAEALETAINKESTTAKAMNTAEENLNTTAGELNAAVKRQQATAEAAETATKKANTVEQELNTSATTRDTATKGLWASVTLLCKQAQDAWNASMFSSPLFLLAATIAGVTYAVYALATAESAHDAALRSSNEAWDDFDKKCDERKSKINSLIQTIQSETATEYQKAEAYRQLSEIAPALTKEYSQAAIAALSLSDAQKEVNAEDDEAKFEKAKQDVEEYRKKVESLQMQLNYNQTHGGSGGLAISSQLENAQAELDRAEDVLNKIVLLRKEADENAKPIEVKIKEAEENEKVRQKIFDFYDRAMALANDWQKANEMIDFSKGETRLDQFISTTEKELAELRGKIKNSPADMSLRMEAEEKEKVLNGILDMKDTWKKNGDTTIPLIFKANWQSAQEALKSAKAKASALANGNTGETYASAYNKAKREYDAANKLINDMKKNKGAYTREKWDNARENLKNAKKAYEDLGGDTTGKTAKAEEKRKKEENTAAQKRKKAEEDLAEQILSLQQRNIEDEIALKEEGTEKKLAQIDSDYKKRSAEIEKQEKKFQKKNKEAGKKAALTSEQRSVIDEAKALNDEEYKKRKAEVQKGIKENERTSIQSYLKEYGNSKQKREALTQEAGDKIKKINDDKSISDTDREYQKKSIQAGLKKSLADLDFEDLKKEINWDFIFGDLENVSVPTLDAVKNQLQEFVNTAKDLQPDQIKTVVDAMSQLQDKMDLAAPTKTIKAARAEYELLSKTYAKYKKEYEDASASGDIVAQKAALDKMMKTEQKMVKVRSKEKKAYEEVKDVVTQYAQALDELGDTIGGTTGDCIKLAASAITCGVSMAEGIKKFGEATSDMEKAIAILAIIEAALKAMQIIVQVFGDTADTTLTDYVETLDTYINLLNDSIDDLNDSMGDTKNTMKETIAYYDTLVKLEKESAKAIKSQSQVWLNSGASKGFLGIGSSASEGVKIREQMAKDLKSGNAEVRAFYEKGYQSLNEYFKKVKGKYAKSISDFGRMDFIWELSDEDLIKLSEDAAALALLGDTLSSAIVDYAKKIKQIAEDENSLSESLLNVSFDDFYDDFTGLIKEMDNTSEDFAQNFAEYMRNALVKNLIAEQYKGKLEELYNKAADWSKKGVLESHIDELKKEYEEYAEAAKKDVENIDKITGYVDSSSQTATSGGWETMGQETAEELNGRFTALQIAGESIAKSMSETLSQMQSIVTIGISTNGAVLEIRNMMIMTNSYLEDVAKYAKLTYNEFGAKMDNIHKRLQEI